MESWRDRLGGFVPRALVATHDLAMVWLCWQVLHRLRYAMLPHTPEFPLWSNEIAVVLLAQGAVFWWMGLYRGLWRFASLPDLWNIVKACAPGSPEDAAWIQRETLLRRMILTPASIMTWALGLCLAASLGFGYPWLWAKLVFVVLLTGYDHWAVATAKKLARGLRPYAERRLRLLNEVPALLIIVIVILVVVKPG